MPNKWIASTHKWVTEIITTMLKKIIRPSTDRTSAILDDYLRIQNMRRLEEERFRRHYWNYPL